LNLFWKTGYIWACRCTVPKSPWAVGHSYMQIAEVMILSAYPVS